MSEYLQKIVYLTNSQYATLAGGGTVGSLTGLNDNYIYITDGKVSLSDLDDSFILPVSNGGTGASSWASGKILVGNGSSTFSTIDKATAATGSTLVQRDANGDFSARNITMTQGNIGNMTLETTAITGLTKITTTSGNGFLAYKPSNWTGVTSSQWGVGTVDIQGVIRSSNSDLLHSRNGTNSVIIDAGNYKTYAWARPSSITTGQVVVSSGADGTTALRAIKNITGSVNNLEWTSSSTDNTLVTTNTLAYWNGRYNSTSSNLAYCNKGAFGTIITNNFPTSNTTTTYLRGDGNWVSLSDMGLSTAMHYKGTVEASPTTTAPTGTFAAGDVVVYDNSEYVYDGTNWRELGSESSFKTIQNAVSSPSVPSSGTTTATAFIDTISQDSNGVITATKKDLPTITNVSISADTTTNKNYSLVFSTTANDDTSPTAAKIEGLQKNSEKLYFNPNSATLSINNGTTTGTLTATNYSGDAAAASKLKCYSSNLLTNANISNVTNQGLTLFRVDDTTTSSNGTDADGILLHFNYTSTTNWSSQLFIPDYTTNTAGWNIKWRAHSAETTWTNWKTILDSINYNTYAAAKSHTHGNITNAGLLGTANRLVWTDGDKKIYAGYHYADTTHIAINSTTVPSKNLYVNGNTELYLNSDASSDKKFLLTGVNAELTISSQGIQSYNKETTTPHVLYLQYAGSDLWIGSSTTTNAVRNFYGKFEFFTTSGFNYSGIGVTSTASTGNRSIWFGDASAPGIPVIDNNFKYNPATNTITIGTGTLSATSYSGNAASASAISATLATTTKTYLLGTSTVLTTTDTNVNLTGDTGIYLTTTAGELSAVRHSFNVSGTEKAYITYNSTDNSLDFVFV